MLELKEKIGLAPVRGGRSGGGRHLVARDALVELGYSLVDAERALAEVDPDLPAEERVRTPCGRRLSEGGMTEAAPHERGGAFLAPALQEDAEDEFDRSLRPRHLAEFVGQERLKEQLEVALTAALTRGEALDHVLLVGPPGLGKTSLAYIIREELGVGIRTVAGPALERKGDLAAILTSLEARDVLFVDEIHRLNAAVEEILYPALEDFRLDIIVGQGPAARTLTLDLPPFTLVGATTRTGLLTTPLRDRFGMTFRLGYYEPDELAEIVARSARILGVEIADDAADEIARRSRGTPRVANRILRRVRDVAEVRHAGAITAEIADEALELLEVDEEGLERTDRELLQAIVHKFGGGPVGLSTLAVSARRGARHDRGRLRAVPAPARLHPADAARTHRHRARARARRRAARRPASTACSDARALDSGLRRPAGRPGRPHPPADRAVRRRSPGSSSPFGRGRARGRRALHDRVAQRRARATGSSRCGRTRATNVPAGGDRPGRVDQADRAEQGRRGARRGSASRSRASVIRSRPSRGTAARASSARARARAARGRRAGRGRRTRRSRRPRRPRAGPP